MATLNQRILIPAGPDAVWDVISNINKNPNWQQDCQEISFLSSRHNGPGTRWRYASANRNEYVVEITAWYDRLGYEYTFIDGVPFQESRGRIRLQEIPEGTIVEWSLSYQLRGVFSGLRNSLGIQRQFESTMEESLKALYTHVRKAGAERDVNDAKSLMREAPDYEARAQYVPRHPSRYTERETEPSGDSEPLIPEPALTDDDTRPNPALTAAEAGDSAPSIREPVELEPVTPPKPEVIADVETPEPAVSVDTSNEDESVHARFKPPAPDDSQNVAAEAAADIAGQDDIVKEPVEPIAESAEPSDKLATSEHEKAAIVTEQSASTADQPEPTTQDQAEAASQMQIETVSASPSAHKLFEPVIDTSDIDTQEISIWEVFGVPRPSDTRPIQAVTAEDDAEESSPALKDVEPIAASETEAAAEPEPTPVVHRTTDEARSSTPEAEAVTARPGIKLGPLQPIPPLPYGFRFHARRKLVKLRRRA